MTSDGVSRVLSQAIRLSSEDQARLLECLKQQCESSSLGPLEASINSTHTAKLHPAAQKQVAANCEVNDKSSPLNFAVEDGLFGKLICSYHLEKDFLYDLDVFFSDAIAEEKGDRSVVNGNHVIMCREEALRLLQEKIERNIRDAMAGLIYEVRLQVLRSFNGSYFFINFNPTEALQTIREFYISCVNDRTNAHQGSGPRREGFLRKIITAYASAAEKANKKATAAVKRHKNARPGRYGIRCEEWRIFDGKRQVFGVVTKAALAREMDLIGHHMSSSVLLRQMRRYEIETSDLDKLYDDDRNARERK